MKEKNIIAELLRITQRLGIKVIEDKLLKKGDYCRVFDDRYIIMDRDIDTEEKINILLRALKKNNLDDIYITPRIREMFNEK